jgi:hypothetical protein
MPTWILIVILLSIGATALLASVLMRMNAPAGQPKPKRDARRRDDGSMVYAGAGDGRGGKTKTDSNDNDGASESSDGGGGDGGGGGGD